MQIKKILWPTDFSKNASAALPYVQSLTESFQTEVHVLYVIDDLGHHEDPWYGELDARHLEKIHTWEKQKAQKRLEEICTNYLDGCPLYIKHVEIGDPAHEILSLAETEGIDMIVMSSRGRRSHFGFGSVAEKVTRNTAVPVVTVPAEGETPAPAVQ